MNRVVVLNIDATLAKLSIQCTGASPRGRHPAP